jgi:two-component system sensor histidine kinase UhpB
MLAVPLIGIVSAWLAQRYWHRFPSTGSGCRLIAAVTLNALLQTCSCRLSGQPATLLLLASLPAACCYAVRLSGFEFLRQQHRYHLLGLDTSNPPLRTSLIIWCSLFFIIGIGTQMVLSRRWSAAADCGVPAQRGDGVEIRLAGRRPLRAARQYDDHHCPPGGRGFSDLLELEIFLSTQSLLGIGWGSPSAASSIWR